MLIKKLGYGILGMYALRGRTEGNRSVKFLKIPIMRARGRYWAVRFGLLRAFRLMHVGGLNLKESCNGQLSSMGLRKNQRLISWDS